MDNCVPQNGTFTKLHFVKKINIFGKEKPMKTLQYSLTAFILSLLIFSCNKDVAKKDEVLVITPEKVASYAGKDWASISSEFSNKKDYLYTKLNNGSVLAAVSLPAKDEGAPASNFKLLFNINQQNRVSAVILTSADSLDVTTGNKLFLYYYQKTFSRMEGVFYSFAIDNYDHQVNIGVDDLLAELNALNCAQAALSYKNSTMDMSAGYFEGTFSFNIFAP